MKIEIPAIKPNTFHDTWPGQYQVFSHYETALGIPQILFLVTSKKKNGAFNAALGSWASFSGDIGGYFAILSLMQKSHTFHNILREQEFCINFIDHSLLDKSWATVFHNDYDTDEIASAGLTSEPAITVGCPRIVEAFLTLECKLQRHFDLSGAGVNSTVFGEVTHAALLDEYMNGSEKYQDGGFLFKLFTMTDFPKNTDGRSGYAHLNEC